MTSKGVWAMVAAGLVFWSMALPQQPSSRQEPSAAGSRETKPAAPAQQVPARNPGTQPGTPAPVRNASQKGTLPSERVVDFEADIMRPIKIGDSSVLNLLGNVIFYHNGAVITCDSAVRYNAKRMECFRNVVINKDSTYVYGDRADYNGEVNLARVYAPIVKMVDGDAVLYTYNFSFNTLDNIGLYSGGGTIHQKDNLLESQRGYYYSDTRDVICVKEVEIKNPDYRMKSDSAAYNMNTEVATFFTKSYIWNAKGEILSADRGFYDRKTSQYRFTLDSYVLTKNQEMWSDTLVYNSESEDAVLNRNIQIRDEEHKVMAFGDFGEYWGKKQDAMLTLDPSLVSFDPKEDTLYMRSDSMFLYTVPHQEAVKIDSLTTTDEEELIIAEDTVKKKGAGDGLTTATEQTVVTEDIPQPGQEKIGESIDVAQGGQAPATKEERKRLRDEARRLEKAAKAAAKAQKKGENVVRETSDRPDGTVKDTLPDPATIRQEEALKQALAGDTITEQTRIITPAERSADSLLLNTPADTTAKDSLDRIVRAYRNVRIFRSDFQAVCDSLVGFSVDSTFHMYIEPVLWNENNQITSEIIDIYTKNQQITKAVFVGEPLMIAEVDTIHYNQIKGKVIEAFFRNNEIYRTDVNGNGQSLYYLTDENTGEANGLWVCDCSDITFMMADKKVNTIIYRGSPVYNMYPLDKIAAEQELFLPGFKWVPERKPSKESVFNRTIRPSQREGYEAMPGPEFPLTDAIMKNKARMIKEGIWRERNDRIGADVLSFIRSLGY